jgi:hypothetical protein
MLLPVAGLAARTAQRYVPPPTVGERGPAVSAAGSALVER